MLFGRKKPGFVTEEGAEETAAEPVAAASEASGKPDLLEYMQSLPDLEEDEFGDVEMPEIIHEEIELTEAQHLAEYIRLRTKGIQLTALSSLLKEVEHFEDLKGEWAGDETCQDIVCVEGNQDVYYYSNQHMSDNYAMITALVEEKDLPKTIVNMVRFNCKTYPVPTPYSYFERSPYYASAAQIERAKTLIESREEYQDIQSLKNNQGDMFFYSTEHMTARYAKALADVDLYTD